MGWPVSASHSRTVLSQLPEAMRVPSGLNATLFTASVWPVSGVADRVGRWPRPTPAPSCRHCRRRCAVPSGLNATLYTASVWPVSGAPIGLAGVGVPHPHRLVVTAGDDALAVGAERHAVHRVGVPGQRLRRSVGRWRRPTPAPSCRQLPETMRCAVGAERHAGHRAGVAGERLADGLAGVRVPHPHRLVVAAGDDALCRRG